VGAEGGVSK